MIAAGHQLEVQDPLIAADLSMPPEEVEQWKKLNIIDLGAFFSHPARFLLQKRFDIYLDEEIQLLDERENFSIDPLEAYHIGRELVEQGVAGMNSDKLRLVQRARGQLPAGIVGDVWQEQMQLDADTFIKQTAPYTSERTLPDLEVDLSRAGFDLNGPDMPI